MPVQNNVLTLAVSHFTVFVFFEDYNDKDLL